MLLSQESIFCCHLDRFFDLLVTNINIGNRHSAWKWNMFDLRFCNCAVGKSVASYILLIMLAGCGESDEALSSSVGFNQGQPLTESVSIKNDSNAPRITTQNLKLVAVTASSPTQMKIEWFPIHASGRRVATYEFMLSSWSNNNGVASLALADENEVSAALNNVELGAEYAVYINAIVDSFTSIESNALSVTTPSTETEARQGIAPALRSNVTNLSPRVRSSGNTELVFNEDNLTLLRVAPDTDGDTMIEHSLVIEASAEGSLDNLQPFTVIPEPSLTKVVTAPAGTPIVIGGSFHS